MNDVILQTSNLLKEYPGVIALDKISVAFRDGEVHALVGENGAGKSTLIKCLSGAISPDSGIIELGNEAYSSLTSALAKEKGIAVIHQEFNLVPSLSAAENVFLNAKTSPGFIANTKEREKMAAQIFESMGVSLDPSQTVWGMSPANMQLVEIAKAISGNVKILIMDEPTAPLTTNEVSMLFKIVKDLRSRGVAIIYISHRLEELFEIADRVTVMRDGKLVDTKNIEDVTRQSLISMMTGRVLSNVYPERDQKIGDEILRVEDLCGLGVEHVNFSLRKGEVLGFAGLVGAGRSEIMSVLYGAYPKTCGNVYINGQLVEIKSPSDAVANGIGLIPEDRKNHGLFLFQSARWNITIGIIKQLSSYGVVSAKKEQQTAEEYISRFSIKVSSPDQLVLNLSGGNQQKVVIAKAMALGTDIAIFDEPTRGVDVGAKWEIYKRINELAESGKAVIMISSELPELLAMCDRIVVLCERTQNGCVPKERFSQELILSLASGGEEDIYE
ncbi:MAG: sugar ABC transporter ATP-binding protein [Clostridiales bacterium]|jgi:ribose transport system ATP-binding protein|nr:sugar ABC transporter ATP-binding protein [Clostridiales bacterium]